MTGTTVKTSEPIFSGVTERPRAIRLESGFRGIIIDLTLPGVRRLTGASMSSLANVGIRARDLLGPQIVGLQHDIIRAPDWVSRIYLAERFLGAKLERATTAVSSVTNEAWAQLVSAGGSIRVGSIVRSLDVSQKTLVRRFLEEIGLSPKRAARLLRLDRTMATIPVRQPSWSVIACTSGYYDQAHLINEFREYTGITPQGLADILSANPSIARRIDAGDSSGSARSGVSETIRNTRLLGSIALR